MAGLVNLDLLLVVDNVLLVVIALALKMALRPAQGRPLPRLRLWDERRCNTMKLKFKDLIATIRIAAIAVPYVGHLINGEMPFIKDPRGMSSTGLVLGTVAVFVMRRDDLFNRVGKGETALAAVSLVLGLVALALAETAAAEVLLAVFMGSIVVVWAVTLMEHTGIFPGAGPRTGLGYR